MIASMSIAEIEGHDGHGGDDTFLPLADFLTLLSLAFIYAALVFSRPSIALGDIGFTVPEAIHGGPALPLDRARAYVAVLYAGEKIGLRVVVPGDDQIHNWELLPQEIVIDEQVSRVKSLLVGRTIPDGVTFFMSPNESRAQAHQLLNELVRSIKGAHPVTVVL